MSDVSDGVQCLAGGRRDRRGGGQAEGGAVPHGPPGAARLRAVADVLRHGLPNLCLSRHRISHRRL